MQQQQQHTHASAAAASAASLVLPRPYVSLDHLYVDDDRTAAQLRQQAAAGGVPPAPAAPSSSSSAPAAAAAASRLPSSPPMHYGGLPTIPENSHTRSTQGHSDGGGGGGVGLESSFVVGGGGSTPVSASHSLTASSSYSGFLAVSAAAAGAFPPADSPPLYIATGSPEMLAPLPPPQQHSSTLLVSTTTTRLVQVGSPPEHGLSQSSSGSSSSVFSASPSATAIGAMLSADKGASGGSGGGTLVSAAGDDAASDSSLSSTFSTSLNHWHRFPPSVFLLHACLLMLVCGFVAGLARGALGLGHSHSGLVGLLRAGVGLDYHATLIAAFTSGSALPEGTHCSEVAAFPFPPGAGGGAGVNSTSAGGADPASWYSPSVLAVCRQAASQSLLYSRVFQAIQCLLLLVAAPTIGRLSDCGGRQTYLLLALLLNVLPQLCLLLHFALGLTPLVFMASQCLPALAPLPLLLLIYVSDVIVQHTSARGVALESRKQTMLSGGEGSIGRSSGRKDSSLREKEAQSIAPPSAAAGGSQLSSSGTSDDPASIMLSSSGSGNSSRRYASTSPGAAVMLPSSGQPQHHPSSSSTRGRAASRPHHRHSGLLLGLGLRKLFAFGLLLSIWCLACVCGMWVSTSDSAGGALASSHIWDAGVGLMLATLSVIYGLFLPESLVPFHRMLLPAVLLPNGTLGASVSGWTLAPRVWRELLSHFQLLRHVVSTLLLAGAAVGFMLGSFVPYIQHHALNSWTGSDEPAGSGHLFPASGLDFSDVMWLGSAMLLAAGFTMSVGCYVASQLDLSLHRLTQSLLAVLVLSCASAFLLRTHILFSFLCSVLFGVSLAAFPAALAWVVLQFDVSEQGKVLSVLYAPACAGVTGGFILAGVGYDAFMESSTATTAEVDALSVPELRLFSLPLLLSLLALLMALGAPAYVTVPERMKYVRHRPTTGQSLWLAEHSASGASASGSAYSSASHKSVNPLSHSGGSGSGGGAGGRGSRSSLAEYVSERDDFRGELSQSHGGVHTPGLSMQRHPSLPLIRESSLSHSQHQQQQSQLRTHEHEGMDDDDDHYLEPYDARAMREVRQAIDAAGPSSASASVAASLGVRDLEANHKNLQQSLLR